LSIQIARDANAQRHGCRARGTRGAAYAGDVREHGSKDRAGEADAELVDAGDAAVRDDEAVPDHDSRQDEAQERDVITNLPHDDHSSKLRTSMSITVAFTSSSEVDCGAGSQCRCTAQNASVSSSTRAATAVFGTRR